MPIQFHKMQALGNDFVVIDATEKTYSLDFDLIQALADRRCGIGFDQLLMLGPGDVDSDFSYRIFNADGGEVAQCGNGARCIARYLQRFYPNEDNSWVIKTQERLMQLQVLEDNSVSVNMGEPVFEPALIPFLAKRQQNTYHVNLDGVPIKLAVLSMGNPHAVYQVTDIDKAAVDTLGAALTSHNQFPDGANIGFMQLMDVDHIRLRVYERGVGETLACGSGACAAVVAAHQQGLVGNSVRVSQAGGDLVVGWDGPGQSVFMSGPAEYLFYGEWLHTFIR